MYSLMVTARMNDVDPQAWLADVLARIADHPVDLVLVDIHETRIACTSPEILRLTPDAY
jgi:hypothetical protein